MPPVVTYDASVHAYEIVFAEGDVARTEEFDAQTLVDLDAEGRLLSIEVLDPAHAPIDGVLARYGLTAEADVVLAEIRRRVPAAIAATGAAADRPFSVATTVVSGGALPSREIDLTTC